MGQQIGPMIFQDLIFCFIPVWTSPELLNDLCQLAVGPGSVDYPQLGRRRTWTPSCPTNGSSPGSPATTNRGRSSALYQSLDIRVYAVVESWC